MITELLLASSMLFCPAAADDDNTAAAAARPAHTLLYRSGDHGSKYYRIPALATATDGSLLAVADRRNDSQADLPNAIDLVVRRSTDGGATWSDQIVIARHDDRTGYGDAALVVDRQTGDVLCISASGCGLWESTAQAPAEVNVSRSRDHGVTWSAPQNITAQLYGPACADESFRSVSGLFAASGRALQLRSGSLLFVVAAHRTGEKWPPLYNYVCRSDDGGETWRMLPAPVSALPCGDESKLVELSDGSWLMSIRNPAKGCRRYARSTDQGATWTTGEWEDLPDPACNGDLLRCTQRTPEGERTLLLHSLPADSVDRRNVSIAVSYDEGRTWPVRKCVWDVPSGYSSLTVLPDGGIGLLTEVGDWDSGFSIWFTRLTLDWLEAE